MAYEPVDYYSLAYELANYDTAGVYISGFVSDPDPILRKRGDDERIFEEILADDQVTQALMGRKNRVLLDDSYSWYAGSLKSDVPSVEAEVLKDMLVEDLERANMHETISAILDTPYYGFIPMEIIWESTAFNWRIKDIVARPCWWFRFDKDGRLCFVGENGHAGEPVPFGKILLVRHHPKYENPYGIRLLSRCLWPFIFKKAGIRFYAEFMEKYGLPFVLGIAASGANDSEKKEIARSLDTLRRGGSGAAPHGTDIKLLAAGSHHADVHESYINFWNGAISKVIMGQTLTAELSGKTGSFAASDTHMEVSEDIAKADKKLVSNALNELAWIYAQINAPHVPAPLHSYDTPEDLSARADLDKKLYDMGVDFNEAYFTDTYGLSKKHFSVRTRNSDSYSVMFAKDSSSVNVTKEELSEEFTKDALIKRLCVLTSLDASELEKIKDLNGLQDYLLNAELDDAELEKIMQAILVHGSSLGLFRGYTGD